MKKVESTKRRNAFVDCETLAVEQDVKPQL